MPIITLTSDLGLKDHHVASVKAAILCRCPEAVIVDISHEVSKFDVLQTAYIIGNAFRDFPPGTIHIIGVRTERTKENAYVAVLYQRHYFVGPDNGIFPLFLSAPPDRIIALEDPKEKDFFKFPMKDIFVKTACALASGTGIDSLGVPKREFFRQTGFVPVVNENSIRGTVIYIDHFGNVIVNIKQELFMESVKNRKFSISVRAGQHTISNISGNYYDVPQGEMLAFFNSGGMLEIAINTGNASELLGINAYDIVLVEFE